jgi:cell wall-associated NlpC family hydrolase
VAAASLVVVSPASAQPSLETRLDREGNHLDAVTEAYNEAHLRRVTLDGKLAAARSDVAESEARLGASRKRLGKAVRDLYMHPASGLGTFFQARSYGELERGSAMAGRLALSTDSLILQIRRARAEAQAAGAHLERLRDEARRDELAMASARREAVVAFERTQGLLAQADLGAREAARQARIADAAGLAAANIDFAGPVRPTAAAAVRAAASQEGKPYRWGAAGPNAYDCSGLTMWAWRHGGVSLPHSSRAQYASLPHVPLSQLAPGDLVFYGHPIHHVGIYKGGGVMIHAPQTGESVREESVWRNPVGAARP